jgi:hypothetical protein
VGRALGFTAEREQARQANVNSGVAQLMAYAAMQQAAINPGKVRSTA